MVNSLSQVFMEEGMVEIKWKLFTSVLRCIKDVKC